MKKAKLDPKAAFQSYHSSRKKVKSTVGNVKFITSNTVASQLAP
jgi:hypothetical protein